MLLTAFYVVLGSFAAPCQQDGDHIVTCQVNKCETVGLFEICTECKTGGVPVDGFCRPFGSIQAAAAGCTKADGTALDKTATTCGKCGDGYFLFMGGCYKTESQPGSEICTTASNGLCTACKVDSQYIFQNKATPSEKGSECILCWDTTDRNGVMGVANCATCTAPASSTGPATCTECMAGTYKKSDTECAACHSDCATCSGEANNQCTSCETGKYLKSNQCVEKNTCNTNHYPDDTSMTCVACTVLDANCATCSFDSATAKGKCLTCNSNKIPRTTLDGTSTCVENSYAGCQGADNELFMKEDQSACLLCGDTKEASNDKGVANCRTCTKNANDSPPTCTACLDGYFLERGSCTTTCADNCATCSEATTEDKCKICKAGFFLASPGEGKCISCSDTNNGGIDGCAECTKEPAGPLKCTKCKPNRKPAGTSDNYTCTEKTCEDPTVCGGTSGACDAIVIDANGKEHYYCSYCGETNKFPIDGLCTDNKGTNAGCTDHTCSYCAAGFFLYMGGCYKIDTVPGSYMCSKSTTAGVCDTPNANNRFFVVPKAISAEQSVLACGNPLGTIAGGNAYVGVEGCSQCTAPDARADGGMAVATCTACEDGKKPGKSGTGCVACPDANCKSCTMDDVCEECADGFSLDNGKCVSSGTNKSGLSTGAIAGISVAAIVVVGGLVGFLCWWFICRGKA
nr:variant-specific surface protein VSP4A1 [Giardia intestinalis]